jgi:hypothetical protein
LKDKNWSEGVAKRAVQYSGKLSFEETAETHEDLAQIEISANSVWRLTQRWGKALQQVEAREDEQANGMIVKTEEKGEKPQSDCRLGASMDGTMIYIRGEEWKELKVGCFYEVEEKPVYDPDTNDWIELGHAINTTYVSHLGGPECFGDKMWTEGQRRRWHQAVDTQVVGDGAPWIWNLVATYFYDAHQTVDWYHAVEHLAQTAQLAFEDHASQADHWRKQQENFLFFGDVDRVIQAILDLAEQKPVVKDVLLKQAAYFINNKHRMFYLDMRTEGWLIGSGVVEGGGKRFKDRFAGSGMRWSRSGAECMLPIRTAILSNRFDERWTIAYNSPPN